jgi:membrane-associated protein
VDFLLLIWDLVVHLDRHLEALLQQYGGYIYLLLFLIIFCETGLVVTPFLPGDSLLFVAGALWATAGLDVHALVATLIVAAILGDNLNYAVGRYLGPRVFKWEHSRIFNRKALEQTHAFYERHGGKTVIIARYLPLIRTFAPFVAGMGCMAYPRFLAFDVFGGILWISSLTYAGYLFGNVAFIKQNLTLVILFIIGLSLTPLIIAWLRQRLARA